MVVRQLRLYGNFQVAPDSSRVSTNVSGSILDRSVKYCTNSVNSAGHVTRYTAAEMKISASRRNDRYIHFFSAIILFQDYYSCSYCAVKFQLKLNLSTYLEKQL